MIKALILIGGKSKRLGRNKYLLDFHGVPQFRYLMSVLEKAGLDTYLSCNREQNDKLPAELPKIVDKYPNIGPKGGILSAFEKFPKTAWLTIACDLPFVNTENILALLKHRDRDCQVTTYRANENFLETTFTIYESSSYKRLIETYEDGDHSLQSVLRTVNLKVVSPINQLDVFNVNNKEDLEQVGQIKKLR